MDVKRVIGLCRILLENIVKVWRFYRERRAESGVAVGYAETRSSQQSAVSSKQLTVEEKAELRLRKQKEEFAARCAIVAANVQQNFKIDDLKAEVFHNDEDFNKTKFILTGKHPDGSPFRSISTPGDLKYIPLVNSEQ